MHLDPVLIGSSEDAFHHGKPVYIVPAARRRHLALFGGTGSGKSTLMRNMLAEDIAAGHGVTVVDPHGQLVEDILENHIPRHRTNDVIYFNPKDQERARETDRHIAENPARFEALKEAKREEIRARFTSFPLDMVDSMAGREARSAIEKEIGLPTLEEFADRKRHGADFLLKPVAVLVDAQTLPVAPSHQEIVMTDDAVIRPDADAPAADRGEEMQPEPEWATQPATPEAGIGERSPESAKPESDGNAVGPAVF